MRPPIKSPIQATINSPLFLVKLAADLFKVHTKFLEKIDTFVGESKSIREEAARIKNLPKGDKGDRGEKGEPGISIPGRDGRDGKDGADAEPVDPIMVAEIAAELITQPKDGKDSPSLETIVKAVVETLKETDALEIEGKMIGVRNEVASYRNQLAGKVYGKDTWARGGGTTVSAGANVTLVPLANGTVQINASGGGSGTNVATQYNVIAVQVGSDITIDLSQLTNFATFDSLISVIKNNLPQTEGASFDFTVSGSTITVFNSSSGDIFNIVYSYA